MLFDRDVIIIKKWLLVFILPVCFFVSSAFSMKVSEPESRASSSCNSPESYEVSKKGGFAIAAVSIRLHKEQLTVIAKIVSNQCEKIAKNRYRWKMVNPYDGFEFEHEYFDFTEKTFKTRRTTVENKKIWLVAINYHPKVVGTGTVAGSNADGLTATVVMPLSVVANPQQMSELQAGKKQSLRVSLFVKSIMRYISNGEATDYEESSGLGQYDVDFTVRKVNGILRLLKK